MIADQMTPFLWNTISVTFPPPAPPPPPPPAEDQHIGNKIIKDLWLERTVSLHIKININLHIALFATNCIHKMKLVFSSFLSIGSYDG